MVERCPDTFEDLDLTIFCKVFLNLQTFLKLYLHHIISRYRGSKSYHCCSCDKTMGNLLFPLHTSSPPFPPSSPPVLGMGTFQWSIERILFEVPVQWVAWLLLKAIPTEGFQSLVHILVKRGQTAIPTGSHTPRFPKFFLQINLNILILEIAVLSQSFLFSACLWHSTRWKFKTLDHN